MVIRKLIVGGFVNKKYILGLSLLSLVGCSGNSGGGSSLPAVASTNETEFGESMTAQFIDAPVKGLKFKTSSGAQLETGAEGKFSCLRGELVSFSLGGLDLGYSACGEKIFVQDLISKTPNYSWNQAAAILQTFSINKTDYLDLSQIDHNQLNLTGISYNSTPANLDLSAELTSALASGAYNNVVALERPSAAITVLDAQTEANNSFTSHVSLSTQLSSVLAQLKDAGGSAIDIDGELISESLIPGMEEENCWKNIKAQASVTSANGVYSFNINNAVSFNNVADLEVDSTCSTGNIYADKCEPASRLPKPKIISGGNIDMIFSSDYAIDTVNVTEQNVLSIAAAIGSDKISFSGIYENKVTITSEGASKGKSLICKYKVSGKKVVQTTVNNGVKKYNGQLNCRDNNGDTIHTGVTAQVEIAGSFPSALASIKIYDGANLVMNKANLSFQPMNDGRSSGYYHEGVTTADLGPIASGSYLSFTKYVNDQYVGNILVFNIGTQNAHCSSTSVIGLTEQ